MKDEKLYKVIDRSYSLKVTEIGFESYHELDLFNNKFRILHSNLTLPAMQHHKGPKEFNNTIIQDIDSSQIYFIQERFLEEIPQKKTHDWSGLSLQYMENATYSLFNRETKKYLIEFLPNGQVTRCYDVEDEAGAGEFDKQGRLIIC